MTDDEFIDAVSEEVGMYPPAWDTVAPERIVNAVLKVAGVEDLRAENVRLQLSQAKLARAFDERDALLTAAMFVYRDRDFRVRCEDAVVDTLGDAIARCRTENAK